jgi:hypothetical protein
MKMGWTILLLILAALPSQVLGAEAEIELTTDPANLGVGFPHSAQYPAETRITVVVRDPATGRPIEGAEVGVKITHEGRYKFLHTGFPWAEGVTIFAVRAPAPEGKLDFSYIFPIRGTYRAEVEARPTAASEPFNPVSREFDLRVRERPESVQNILLLLGVLLVFGGIVGFVFGRRGE